MAILNIAEKPSVANSISRILSTTASKSKGLNKYCPNIYFDIEYKSRNAQMIFTSVLGHLMEINFTTQDKNWKRSDPRILFDTEIVSNINPEHEKVAENIKKLSLKAELVVIWTDCDREGENIAYQIENVINEYLRAKKRQVEIKRARFSGISKTEIQHALNNLVDINYNEAQAVDARKELDLRIGSVFTRMQTISYDKGNILSFGPCQIPTLNFVVQRHFEIEKFVPEKFYSLENCIVSRSTDERNKNDVKNIFKWRRQNLFDKNCVVHFYNELFQSQAIITDKKMCNKEKYRPLPLRTVEFQKTCSSYYKIDSHRIMEIAEKLYNNGYISYPRTETDAYPKNFGFNEIINKLKNDSSFTEYLENYKFKSPRSGKNNDQAHSPIYPLKSGSGLVGDERKIYEFVARRFLGSVSENAKGIEIEYVMRMKMKRLEHKYEEFTCKGLTITERNYLDVYIYDKWESNEIGQFNIGDIVPNNLELKEGSTTKPEYLSESDLISLMDKNGIGTDATIHEHIQKIQERQYVKKTNFKFKPLMLGVNLIKAYNTIQLPISEPSLRKSLEENLKKICVGERNKSELVMHEIASYKQIYDKLVENIGCFKDIMDSPGHIDDSGDDDTGASGGKPSKGKKAKKKDDAVEKKKAKRGYEDDCENISNKKKPKIKNDCKTTNVKNITEKKNINQKSTTFSSSKETKVFTMSEYNKTIKSSEFIKRQIQCDCGKEARLFEAKNGGRKFYNCFSVPKKCKFFEWADQPQSENDELCFCGYEPKKKIANTENNKGREFLCCNKSYKKCKFFKWAE